MGMIQFLVRLNWGRRKAAMDNPLTTVQAAAARCIIIMPTAAQARHKAAMEPKRPSNPKIPLSLVELG